METIAKPATGRASGARAALVGAALALLVVAGTASQAGAERVPANGDSQQRACRNLQDRNNDLKAEYKKVAVANPGSARLDAILAEMKVIGQDWDAIKCKDRYGGINAARVDGSLPVFEVEPSNPLVTDVDPDLPFFTEDASEQEQISVEDLDLAPELVSEASEPIAAAPLEVGGAHETTTETELSAAIINVPNVDLGSGGINDPGVDPAEAAVLVPADDDLGSGGINNPALSPAVITPADNDDLGIGTISPVVDPAEPAVITPADNDDEVGRVAVDDQVSAPADEVQP